MNKNLRVWIEGTIIAAMGMALSYIPIQTANAALDLSLGLVPLVLYSYRRGALAGMTAGFVWGLLNIVLGSAMKNFISVPQIIFEYPFAFAFGGLGGLLGTKVRLSVQKGHQKQMVLYIVLGAVLACLSRWFWHFWAGVFVWGAYAPENMSPWLYSFSVNGASALGNIIYVAVVLVILAKVAPRLFIPKDDHGVWSATK
ncbi:MULTISPECIES: energy-coupled thiamine transporter ThiT [Enterococcus]|uniref:Thiamine transporter n=1 Tax=Enterococcus diestrammenae TaxID=1155073 RepID=A0ABV0EXM5_9ENTE|nr:energy-coupled thiamine transporter ThiT [Enterococcus diestrammenae]KAF1299686.1 energy-coupled thiamine transporter ThiT [Enterococcus diestrammenae]HIX70092.1 energy-coupled thiamine transporter ThiT [Candidatus Enterococcus stercoravium]